MDGRRGHRVPTSDRWSLRAVKSLRLGGSAWLGTFAGAPPRTKASRASNSEPELAPSLRPPAQTSHLLSRGGAKPATAGHCCQTSHSARRVGGHPNVGSDADRSWPPTVPSLPRTSPDVRPRTKRAGRRAGSLSSRRPAVERVRTPGPWIAPRESPVQGTGTGRRSWAARRTRPATLPPRTKLRFGGWGFWWPTPTAVQREALIVSFRPPGRWISSPPRPCRCRPRARVSPPRGAGDSCGR